MTGTDYSAGKFICLSKRRQLKHGWVFRRQGGLSLMGKGVKSKRESLLQSDTSSCSMRANNKTHTHTLIMHINTQTHTARAVCFCCFSKMDVSFRS